MSDREQGNTRRESSEQFAVAVTLTVGAGIAAVPAETARIGVESPVVVGGVGSVAGGRAAIAAFAFAAGRRQGVHQGREKIGRRQWLGLERLLQRERERVS